ncbi:MAG TPA: hypothetical protein VMB85_23475 [Bryobacteraceae bacterium]|nr:hypothetical protein [Bryobacteraceae bacterium]
MDKEKRHDLNDVMREEKSRGRRPIDTQAQREHEEDLRGMRKLLELGTEEEFKEAMRAYGYAEDSPQMLNALRIWRAFRP